MTTNINLGYIFDNISHKDQEIKIVGVVLMKGWARSRDNDKAYLHKCWRVTGDALVLIWHDCIDPDGPDFINTTDINLVFYMMNIPYV